MELKAEWFTDKEHMMTVVRLLSEQRNAGKREAFEQLRQQTAKRAEHFRGDARRFAMAHQYGTAWSMAQSAEAHGLLCMEIAREIGIRDEDALKTSNVELTGSRAGSSPVSPATEGSEVERRVGGAP